MVTGMDTRLLKVVAGLLAVLAVFASAFVLPAHKPEAHHVPVGVVGPPSVRDSLEAVKPGALDVKSYATEADARHAIDHREIYGALVGNRLLVASAASNSVAQAFRNAAAQAKQHVTVEDVVPLAAEDSRGATLNQLSLALIIACSLAVLALTSLGYRGRRLLGAIGLFALTGGSVVVALIGKAVGTLPGSYLVLSAAATLLLLAIALPMAGLQRLLGQAGGAVGGLFFMLVANPASGNPSAPEMLPDGWRTISQLMPPGAGGTTLRNIAYFHGNALLRPLLVLSAYAAGGLALALLGEALRRRRTRIPQTPKPAELKRAA